MLPLVRKAIAVWLVGGAVALLLPADAAAATADLLEKGRVYCASTHANHGTIAGFGPALDLNGRTDDFLWPVHAPGEGRVTVFSRGAGGFGNSIIWIAENGRERIHMAHLHAIGRTGRVRAGDVIGRVGSTGQSTGSHLHVAASIAGKPAFVFLHGQLIRPGHCYRSRGPIPPRCLGRDATMLGTAGRDRLPGSPADDVFWAKGGRDVIRASGGRDRLCGGSGADKLVGGLGRDHISGGDGGDVHLGGSGGDRLAGGDGHDRLLGGSGRDRLRAGAAGDRLAGGPGGDRLLGGSEGDVLRGAGGDDALTGGHGRDTLRGGRGGDRVRGGGDSDRLTGDGGRDALLGGEGDDGVHAGAGADRVQAGEGDDVVDGGIGPDRLIGGLGHDLASYVRSAHAVIASLQKGTGTTSEATDFLDGFESLRGSKLADQLTGDAGDNSIHGGAGDDVLDGLGGDNFLDGGPGLDTCLNGSTTEGCEA